jgi:hypothetical protein
MSKPIAFSILGPAFTSEAIRTIKYSARVFLNTFVNVSRMKCVHLMATYVLKIFALKAVEKLPRHFA